MKLKTTLSTTAVIFALAWPSTQGLAADAGKAVYDKSCAGCHGADGTGNMALAKTLGEKGLNIVGKETKEKSDEVLLKIIADGAGKMPASKKLTAAEQKAVLRHSSSLAK